MKKRKMNSLMLNKQKISQLETSKGGIYTINDQVTMSTCSCVTCRPDSCETNSNFVCPPPETQFCTVECQTLNCTFVNCDTTQIP